MNEVVGFRKKQYPAGTYLSEKPRNITNIDEVQFKFNCVDGSIVNGTRESILFSFSLSSPAGFKIFEQPTSNLFKKVNKNKIGEITFYLEDDDNHIVEWYWWYSKYL